MLILQVLHPHAQWKCLLFNVSTNLFFILVFAATFLSILRRLYIVRTLLENYIVVRARQKEIVAEHLFYFLFIMTIMLVFICKLYV